MEAVAKHNFTATAQDELSFNKDDILKVYTDMSAYVYSLFAPFEVHLNQMHESMTTHS